MTLGPSWPDVESAIRESQARVFLFSGGGNDLAGPEFLGYLHHRALSDTPVREESFRTVLRESFEPCIRRMSQAVADASPETRIFMHGYDYALPDGRSVNLIIRRFGPWLKPSFDIKGWGFEPARLGVMRLIDMYNELLGRLADELPNFEYVDLRNTIRRNEWSNELHPNNAGFGRCADGIHDAVMRVVTDW
jgi:hypothetical protein